MNTSKENVTILLLTVTLLGISYAQFTSTLLVSSGTLQHVGYTGMVCVYKNDHLIECDHNVLVNLGKNVTTKQLFNEPAGISATDYVESMVLGNTTDPAAADAAHPGKIAECGLSEQGALTWESTGTSDGNVTTYYTWTSTCGGGIQVSTTGLETATTSTYFAGKSFTAPVTLQMDDQLTVRWYVWITGA